MVKNLPAVQDTQVQFLGWEDLLEKRMGQLSLVVQSCLTFATSWTAACQASLSITNSWSVLKLMPIKSVMPYNHLILCYPLILPPSIFPSIRVFSSESVLCVRSQNIAVSTSPSVFPMNVQDWFPLRWSPFSPRNSQESSPTPQFKSVNSSVLSFLYSPTLTSIHEYWKKHSFD